VQQVARQSLKGCNFPGLNFKVMHIIASYNVEQQLDKRCSKIRPRIIPVSCAVEPFANEQQ
jgi:hypothetical protein